ncbi:hypothetical protein VPH35_078851 [Triticum aestivum]|uniref:Uncharacterized protein n=1 Tax=Aegilops tauschii subsp. strangulata TaxID=200361 RepID=A0A453IJS5_AEGTS
MRKVSMYLFCANCFLFIVFLVAYHHFGCETRDGPFFFVSHKSVVSCIQPTLQVEPDVFHFIFWSMYRNGTCSGMSSCCCIQPLGIKHHHSDRRLQWHVQLLKI